MTQRVWCGILLLSLLEGSGWIFDQVAPGVLHGLLRTAVHDAALSLGFALLSLRNRRQSTLSVRLALELATWSVALFAVPQILYAAADRQVYSLTELLVSLLVPAVVVVVVSQRSASFGRDDNPLRSLAPALAAFGGATLVLPFYWPPSVAGRVWLVALGFSAVVAGFAAVRLHVLLCGVGVLRGAAVIFGTVSLAAAAFCWADWSGAPAWAASDAVWDLARCVALEAPIALLTVWLLREMAPVRFSSRGLLVVLVMIGESYAMERPPLTWTTALGVTLIAGGAAGLLRADSRKVL